MDEERIKNRRGYERTLLGTFYVGLGAALVGALLGVVHVFDAERYGVWFAVAGLVALSVALELAYPLKTLRTVGLKTAGGTRYDKMRLWTRLKVASILLNLLAIISAGVLIGALLSRIGILSIGVESPTVARVVFLSTLLLSANIGWAFNLSLKTPIERTRAGLEGAFFQLTLVGGVIFALVSLVLTFFDFGVQGLLQFDPVDLPFYLLAGYIGLGIALFISRSLPNLTALFTEEREFYKGKTYLSKSKSVVMPTMIAFALLFLIILVLVVFELGIIGLVEEIPRNAVLVTVLGFISVAFIASVVVSLVLARSKDQARLYRRKLSKELKQQITLIGVSVGVAGIFFALSATLWLYPGLLSGIVDQRRWLDFLCLGLLSALGPYGFYYSRRRHRIRKLEERFPDFLRDLSASRRAGLTLEASVAIAAKGEYGPLSPEIQKMADQLSWSVPFEECLARFQERVKTPLIQRAVTLITEASRTGGHVTDVLLAAATDARELKNLENERRTTMGLYTVIVYITFAVFLTTAAVLYGTFIPQLIAASEAALEAGATGFGGITFGDLTREEYRGFYFIAAVMQALGNGMVAGLMESGRARSGLRHSFIMVAITYVAFGMLLP